MYVALIRFDLNGKTFPAGSTVREADLGKAWFSSFLADGIIGHVDDSVMVNIEAPVESEPPKLWKRKNARLED